MLTASCRSVPTIPEQSTQPRAAELPSKQYTPVGYTAKRANISNQATPHVWDYTASASAAATATANN